MKNVIKWRVMEKETGRFASFHRRGWPSAEHKESGRPLFAIDCPTDEYTNGRPPHGPLFLRFAKSDGTGKWNWAILKQQFATIQELKARAKEIYEQHPECFV